MKKTETSPEKDVAATAAPVTEFDGYIDVREPQIDGTYLTTRSKRFLSFKETVAWLKANDPAKYFRDGTVPIEAPKALGQLLDDDTRYEKQVFNEAFKGYDDLLFFKHDLINMYTILVPKTYTELEIDGNGEIISRLVRYDTRSVPFTGKGNIPAQFDKDYFMQKAKNIKASLSKAKEVNGVKTGRLTN